mgnify:CR=1 FL=1
MNASPYKTSNKHQPAGSRRAGHACPYNPIKKQPPAQASYLGGRLLF